MSRCSESSNVGLTRLCQDICQLGTEKIWYSRILGLSAIHAFASNVAAVFVLTARQLLLM